MLKRLLITLMIILMILLSILSKEGQVIHDADGIITDRQQMDRKAII